MVADTPVEIPRLKRVGDPRTASRCWLPAVGRWLLVVGCWLLAVRHRHVAARDSTIHTPLQLIGSTTMTTMATPAATKTSTVTPPQKRRK